MKSEFLTSYFAYAITLKKKKEFIVRWCKWGKAT